MRESTPRGDLRDAFHLLDLDFDLSDVKGLPSYRLALVHLHPDADELHKLTASNEFLRRRERERRRIGVFEANAQEPDPVLVPPVAMLDAAVQTAPLVGAWAASSSSRPSTPTARAPSPGTPPRRPCPPPPRPRPPPPPPPPLAPNPRPRPPPPAALVMRPAPTLDHAPVSLTDKLHLVWLGGLSSLSPKPSLLLLRHHLTSTPDAARPLALAWGRDTHAYALAAYRSPADAQLAVRRIHGLIMPGTGPDVLVANRPGGSHRFRASEIAKGVLSRWLSDGVVPELTEWDKGGLGYRQELDRCRTEQRARGLFGRVEGLAEAEQSSNGTQSRRVEGLAEGLANGTESRHTESRHVETLGNGTESELGARSAAGKLLDRVQPQVVEHDFPFAFPFAPSPVGSPGPGPEHGKRVGERGDWVESMKRAKMAS